MTVHVIIDSSSPIKIQRPDICGIPDFGGIVNEKRIRSPVSEDLSRSPAVFKKINLSGDFRREHSAGILGDWRFHLEIGKVPEHRFRRGEAKKLLVGT